MKNDPFCSKFSQRDIAGILKVDTKTLYNWRKNKKELYAIVMLGFKFKEILNAQQHFAQELESIESEVLSQTRLRILPPPPPNLTTKKPKDSSSLSLSRIT